MFSISKAKEAEVREKQYRERSRSIEEQKQVTFIHLVIRLSVKLEIWIEWCNLIRSGIYFVYYYWSVNNKLWDIILINLSHFVTEYVNTSRKKQKEAEEKKKEEERKRWVRTFHLFCKRWSKNYFQYKKNDFY